MSCKNPIALFVAVTACLLASPVLSAPVSPVVVAGSATFNQAGNVLTVANSNGAIINWQKFSIQAGETTHFAQTAASSTVLNRVLSDPTAIYRTLSSNGRVGLVNPAGSVYLTGRTVSNESITTTNGATILTPGATISLIDSAAPGVKVEIIGAKNNTTNLEAIMANANRVGIAGAMVRDSARPSAPIVVNQGGRVFLQVGSSGLAPN